LGGERRSHELLGAVLMHASARGEVVELKEKGSGEDIDYGETRRAYTNEGNGY